MCSVTSKRTKTISDNNQEQSVPIDESVDTSNIDKIELTTSFLIDFHQLLSAIDINLHFDIDLLLLTDIDYQFIH